MATATAAGRVAAVQLATPQRLSRPSRRHAVGPRRTANPDGVCPSSPPPDPSEDDGVGAAASGSTVGVASSSASLDRVGIYCKL